MFFKPPCCRGQAGKRAEGKKVGAGLREKNECVLASRSVIVYQTAMDTCSASFRVIRPAFAGESARALFSNLLLLGLSGDRRAR